MACAAGVAAGNVVALGVALTSVASAAKVATVAIGVALGKEGVATRATGVAAMTGVASASLTPTLPKRQGLRRRLQSLRLGMAQPQQRTPIVRSSSQTISSRPIMTNFVAFNEQQEVAVGVFPHRLSHALRCLT